MMLRDGFNLGLDKIAMVLRRSSVESVAGLSKQFAREGAVSIDQFLATGFAKSLLSEMQSSDDWLEIFAASGKTYEMPGDEFDKLPAAQKSRLIQLSHEAARTELQYRYRAMRVSEDPSERATRGLAVDRFADLMNAPETLEYLRQVTGQSAIELVDAQATAYRPGDFLTNHDDNVPGKNRLAAYVLSLTPNWSMDWGGLLLLERGGAIDGFAPAFNSLRIFSVPQNHCVSIVAPWVTETRYSITGWLRSAGS